MDRKIYTILLMMMMILCLISCEEMVAAQSIELDPMPKTNYLTGEDLDCFTALVHFNNNSVKAFDYPNDADKLQIAGFSTENVGSFILMIKYQNVSINLIYTVNDRSKPLQ